MTLSAEKTIDIAVFMSRQAHVVDIGGKHDIIGKGHGAIPKRKLSIPFGLSATAKNDLRS